MNKVRAVHHEAFDAGNGTTGLNLKQTSREMLMELFSTAGVCIGRRLE
ncbi:hypothetical protein GLW04_02910 [Halobacillus litoralis]|uniref:Uncharacterized protein n=1 Tax=Halobacillus litoralis TaxID=45668 RepID=A0A845DN81_9BACI|nr:hypothetical protein [Halobacillus litoralis]MYL18823.1 hypothetical protein [Halobacillus litoralis]